MVEYQRGEVHCVMVETDDGTAASFECNNCGMKFLSEREFIRKVNCPSCDSIIDEFEMIDDTEERSDN